MKEPIEDSPCGKRKFCSKTDAARAIQEIRNVSSRAKVPTRAYFCVECRGWHLTSKTIQPMKTKADRKKYKRRYDLKRVSI